MADLLRVSLLGALPGGEEWSVNPCYSIGGDFGGVSVSAAQALTIATAISAVAPPVAMLVMWSGGTSYTGVRVEARTKAGALESQAEVARAATVGTGTAPHPYQTSLVLSLRTATPGPSGRGRLYWPATGVPLQTSDLRVATANVGSFVTAFKTWLSGIDTAIEATLSGVGLTVWSRKQSAVRPVTSIQMGNICDVQRRRRDTLIEAVSSTTYP